MSSKRRRRSEDDGEDDDQDLAPKLREKSDKLKQLDLFYRDPAGGVAGGPPKPEDCVPDLPENKEVREFLASAPTKGLWMPLGKEVKVMQCWRCKQYGHRTGDRECPLASKGNLANEQFRMAHEDPMYHMQRQKNDEQDEESRQKEIRIAQMKAILEEQTTDEEGGAGGKKKKKKKRKKKSKPKNLGEDKESATNKKKKKKRRLHPSSSSDSND